MEDLSYIIGLGFSGSDIWRAVTIAFFAAMMVRNSRQVALTAAWALLVDRVIWPLLDFDIGTVRMPQTKINQSDINQVEKWLDETGFAEEIKSGKFTI